MPVFERDAFGGGRNSRGSELSLRRIACSLSREGSPSLVKLVVGLYDFGVKFREFPEPGYWSGRSSWWPCSDASGQAGGRRARRLPRIAIRRCLRTARRVWEWQDQVEAWPAGLHPAESRCVSPPGCVHIGRLRPSSFHVPRGPPNSRPRRLAAPPPARPTTRPRKNPSRESASLIHLSANMLVSNA